MPPRSDHRGDRLRAPVRARGAIVIGTALMLLVLLTMVVLAALRFALGEQRSVRSEWQSRRSAAQAEAALQRGAMWLRRNPAVLAASANWSACTASAIDPPCGDGRRNRFDEHWTAWRDVAALRRSGEAGCSRLHLLMPAATPGAAAPAVAAAVTVTLVGEGRPADDDASRAALQWQDLLLTPQLARFPEATVVAPQLQLGGDGSVIAHPDGAGSGRALSLWAAGDARLADAARSCPPASAIDDACPVAASLSTASSEGSDVLDVDGNAGHNRDSGVAPGDPLSRYFGVEPALWMRLRDMALRLGDCHVLDSGSAGLAWIDGDCQLASGASVGSPSAPLVLVVANGRLLASGGRLHGLVLLLAHDGGAVGAQLDGGFVLRGPLVSNQALSLLAGRYSLRHDAAVAAALTGPAAPKTVAVVPGSWRDY